MPILLATYTDVAAQVMRTSSLVIDVPNSESSSTVPNRLDSTKTGAWSLESIASTLAVPILASVHTHEVVMIKQFRRNVGYCTYVPISSLVDTY